MRSGLKITGWVFGLIFAYLVLTHGDAVNNLVGSIGGFMLKGTTILQGRNAVGVTG